MTFFNHPTPNGHNSNLYTEHESQSNHPLGFPRQELLMRALLHVQRVAGTSPDLRIDLPAKGEVRMRNLVHRGAQRPVFKATSVKLDRVVQCESVLEHEAFLLLDVCPSVQAFSEQPVQIQYILNNELRRHIPDFAVLMEGRVSFVEIKFAKDVDEEVSIRTRWLGNRLGSLGVDYYLLTENQLRSGAQIHNAVCVLRRARHTICEVQLLSMLERLRSAERLPLSSFGWSIADSFDAIGVAKLIMSGHAAIDQNVPLSDRSCVWLAESGHQVGGVA